MVQEKGRGPVRAEDLTLAPVLLRLEERRPKRGLFTGPARMAVRMPLPTPER